MLRKNYELFAPERCTHDDGGRRFVRGRSGELHEEGVALVLHKVFFVKLSIGGCIAAIVIKEVLSVFAVSYVPFLRTSSVDSSVWQQ